MQELLQQIPDVSLFLALAPEELGTKLLFLMRVRVGNPAHQLSAGQGSMFMLSSIEAELWPQTFGGSGPTPYRTLMAIPFLK